MTSIEWLLWGIGFVVTFAAIVIVRLNFHLLAIRHAVESAAADLHFLRDLTEHNGTVPCPTCSGSGIDPRAAPGRKVNCLTCGGSKRVTP